MKVTYTEKIESHMAWRHTMYCPKCGAHEYDIVEQVEPKVDSKWYVRCPQCGFEGPQSPLREIAIGRWKQC